jgi:hypothetical protein
VLDDARLSPQLQPCSIHVGIRFYTRPLFVLFRVESPRLLPDLGFYSLDFSPMEPPASLSSLCSLRSLLLVWLRSTPPSPARSCPLRRCARPFFLLLLPPPWCGILVLLRDLGLRFFVSRPRSVPHIGAPFLADLVRARCRRRRRRRQDRRPTPAFPVSGGGRGGQV